MFTVGILRLVGLVVPLDMIIVIEIKSFPAEVCWFRFNSESITVILCTLVKKTQNTAARNLVVHQRKAKSGTKKPAKTVYVDLMAQREGKDTELPQPWMKIGIVQLSQADKDILLHPRAWLNDKIIHAAQVLLKSQVPLVGGLQEPCKGQVCSFDIERGEFVQILHDGHGHWLMVSTVGAKNGEVYIYDSMYPSVGTYSKKTDCFNFVH